MAREADATRSAAFYAGHYSGVPFPRTRRGHAASSNAYTPPARYRPCAAGLALQGNTHTGSISRAGAFRHRIGNARQHMPNARHDELLRFHFAGDCVAAEVRGIQMAIRR